ncbi:MAG: T9SS type A sorting domain-containing protein [Bacteroidia bacterium]
MRYLPVIFIMCYAVSLKAQVNLVPNGSFEAFTNCPNTQNQIYYATPWTNPTFASPDYYNACAINSNMYVPETALGFQEAHSGDAYTGFYTFQYVNHNIREYIQVELTDTISRNKAYLIKFYVNLPDEMGYAISSLGAFFSKTAITRNDMQKFDSIPQIISTPDYPLTNKTEWMLISDTLISNTGGEKYMTIGNFNDDSESDTLFVSTVGEEDGNRYKSYYFIDDVSVIALDTHVGVNETDNRIKIYPNPTTSEITVSGYSPAYIKLCDAVGQTCAETKSNKLYVGNLSQGLYVLQVFDENGQAVKTEKVIVAK